MIDFETTGFDPSKCRVIEIGIVTQALSWGTLVNPGIPIPRDVPCNITDEDVRGAPPFPAREVAERLVGHIPAAYNAPFDRAFLQAEFQRAGVQWKQYEWIDPLCWARHFLKDQRSRTLGAVCERLGIKLREAHRAENDARAALEVLFKFAPQMPAKYGEMIDMQKRLQAEQRRGRA